MRAYEQQHRQALCRQEPKRPRRWQGQGPTLGEACTPHTRTRAHRCHQAGHPHSITGWVPAASNPFFLAEESPSRFLGFGKLAGPGMGTSS